MDETYVHNVATNSRGGGIIEPQIKRQWFIMVDKPFKSPKGEMTLKQWMRQAVESGGTKISPEHFEKIYYHWIDNLRDWCISRQIWFGHRIPAWFHSTNAHVGPFDFAQDRQGDEVKVQIDSPGTGWEQDPDVLDTWFSSGLWTFSTLGWPEETDDLKTYHPTSVLETGYDILFFWVARMVLMSGFFLGDVPFRQVYLHGLVRDAKGRKMSKSLGNIIDPLDMVEKYGADATRLSLVVGAAPGNDMKLSEDRVRGYKHFANKVWNIARFVLENGREKGPVNVQDEKLIAEARDVAKTASAHIDNLRLDLAADAVYHFVWDRFAAQMLEESKPIFKSSDAAAQKSRVAALYEILLTSLKLLHPFMPFVTEAVWQKLPQKDADQLMVAKWPA